MKKDIDELVNDFCHFAELQYASDAELPNIRPTLAQFFGNEVIKKWVKDYDFSKWDIFEDVLAEISPEFLAYILLAAKQYWKED